MGGTARLDVVAEWGREWGGSGVGLDATVVARLGRGWREWGVGQDWGGGTGREWDGSGAGAGVGRD